ncbi:hypothetical protein IE81DRAFT_323047 [Ceraceosorus guamensis]|uniref:RRM domain-containing protein n=1 Tax=Ceraceosorus guamensis TaxID=1522189 RepID=A0A316VZ33_9BASI|nr:hypothetical protein IE81DRAFT_323047 [Ceraceosorus guamensis]PWN42906.1 hypothetical protein IE81DRAFT_323047 [Ceraceosorus guamensis]
MAAPGRGSRVIFVGNIPYDMSEEQLIGVFQEVGKVIGFRLVFDRDTGKPKGYGFCEFEDVETAASAVRNLHDVDVGGRTLRIDYADVDPLFEGKTTSMGHMEANELPPGSSRKERMPNSVERGRVGNTGGPPPRGAPAQGWGGAQQSTGPFGQAAPTNLPQGQALPPGADPTDAISQTLAALPPGQLLEIIGHLKALVNNSPDQARSLLASNPQISYAVFQAMLMMNVVDPAVLQRIITAQAGGQAGVPTYGAPAPAQAPVPMTAYGAGAPQAPQSGYGGYGAPAQAPVPAPSQPAAAASQGLGNADLPEDQKALLLQVLQLTPEQINALPEDQRAGVLALKAQMGQ